MACPNVHANGMYGFQWVEWNSSRSSFQILFAPSRRLTCRGISEAGGWVVPLGNVPKPRRTIDQCPMGPIFERVVFLSQRPVDFLKFCRAPFSCSCMALVLVQQVCHPIQCRSIDTFRFSAAQKIGLAHQMIMSWVIYKYFTNLENKEIRGSPYQKPT